MANTVADLVSHAKLTRIVLVDDDFGHASPAPLVDRLFVLNDEALRAMPGLQGAELEAENPDLRRTKISAILKKLDPETLAQLDGQVAAPEQDTTLRSGFEPLPAGFDYREMGPAEWEQQRETLVAQAASTLFIFDLSQTRAGGAGEFAGAQQVGWIQAKAKGAPCVLLSGSFDGQDYESNTIMQELLARGYAPRETFVPLSKEHLRQNHEEAFKRLRIGLLQPLRRKMTEASEKLLRQGVDKAMDGLRRLSPEEFEQVVINSSVLEGEWPPNTLFRVLRIDVDASIFEASTDAALAEAAAATNDYVVGLPSPSSTPIAKSVLRLQSRDIYVEGQTLAATHAPLDLGDVFSKTGSPKIYVVVAQSCDLRVRADGKRGRATHAAMARVLTKAEADKKRGNDDDGRRFFKLPAYGPVFEDHYVDLQDWVYGNLDAMDLCILSKTGAAELVLNSEPAPQLIAPWKQRHKRLNERLEVLLAQRGHLNAATIGGSLLPSIKKRHVPPSTSDPDRPEFAGEIDRPASKWSYELKRIRRVKRVWAEAILGRFMEYQAREAFDHPFTLGLSSPAEVAAPALAESPASAAPAPAPAA
jgi:hypothetical protein